MPVGRVIRFLAVTAACALPAPAHAGETALDPGPVQALGSGFGGHFVYAALTPAGVVLRDVTSAVGSAPVDLSIAPLDERPGTITVGDGPSDGDATAVYAGCRQGTCATFAYHLESRAERRLAVPHSPRGCGQGDARFSSRRLYVTQTGPKHCRPGLYSVTHGRLVRRLAATDLIGLSMDDGRVAFVRLAPHDDQRVQVVVQRVGARRGKIVYTDDAPGADCDVRIVPRLSARTLLLGVKHECGEGQAASVVRLDLSRHTPGCSQTLLAEDEARRVWTWGFAGSRLLYAAAAEAGSGLVERTGQAFSAC